ncbi:MAG: glycosyltransferase family 4 protein [Pseudomonadota bacterium]|nr:glycosyltransferase family 4 protein [Pseudomonadota bacterium]
MGSSNVTARDGILLVHWTFPPTTGGVESHLVDLARAISRIGGRVLVLTGEPEPLRDANYSVISTPLLELSSLKNGASSQRPRAQQLCALLQDVVAAHGVGLIHGHNLHHFDGSAALAIEQLRRERSLRVYHTFHETWPDLLSERPVYREWDKNFAVSRHVRQECEDRLGFRPLLFPLGIDTEAFRPKTECLRSLRSPVLLHPARLLPWKGVHVSLHALRILLDRGFEAELVVTDTQRIADWNDELAAYRRQIAGLIEDLRLGPAVKFRAAAYEDMPGLYEEADIVLYPTVGDEPYGLVPLEAMSCARPIVATRSGGMCETILDGVVGYLVPKGDPNALAERVIALLREPDLARRLGQAGRRRVCEHFDSARYAKALLSF